MMGPVTVIGAGLAGCEAAWQVAENGFPVELVEMKPKKFSPAHQSEFFAELICSNSLKAARVESAAGLLKEEMRRLGSLLVPCADACRVPAGGALAVDRQRFSQMVTEKIRSHPNITVRQEEVQHIPEEGIVIIATGPLTEGLLAEEIFSLCGGKLSFFDAAAPIVTAESLDRSCCFAASRYDHGEDSAYLNCPMNKEEYEIFLDALIHAERAPVHDFDVQNPKVYEGCMPVEVMGQRGKDTLRYGPLKPVGLRDPRTGHRPWAVVQLRREDQEGTLYNLVGFQTNLRFPEQKRVFGLIPGLAHAEFVRYGVMHRNTFLNSPGFLGTDYAVLSRPNLFFAGQITGVQGYMESASSGLLAGKNAVCRLKGLPSVTLPRETMMGALSCHVAESTSKDFQPMGANFGVMPPLAEPKRDKLERYAALAHRGLQALEPIRTMLEEEGIR